MKKYDFKNIKFSIGDGIRPV